MTTISDIIALVTIAAPIRHHALSVYPLMLKGNSALANYLVLDEALATKAFRVTEVSDGGTVPRLLAINETSSPVLLLDGEELVGAKQNRVLNLSVMVAGNSKTEIPVSCVEAGRWRTESSAFRSAATVQYSRARAEKLSQVSRSLHSMHEAVSDQHAVWEEIAAKSSRMGVSSPTSAMADIYQSRQDELRDYLGAIPTVDDQVGAVYAIGKSIVGLELFDTSGTYRHLANKLIGSYALDAMEESETTEAPDNNNVQAFVDAVRSAARQRFMAVGIGETVRLSSDVLVGAALEVGTNCVHLSAFHRQADTDKKDEIDTIRARMQRSRLRASRQ
jgi:hypothetical protein